MYSFSIACVHTVESVYGKAASCILQPCSSSSMRHAPVQAATSLLDFIPYYRYMYVTILARFHYNLIKALFSAW